MVVRDVNMSLMLLFLTNDVTTTDTKGIPSRIFVFEISKQSWEILFTLC